MFKGPPACHPPAHENWGHGICLYLKRSLLWFTPNTWGRRVKLAGSISGYADISKVSVRAGYYYSGWLDNALTALSGH